MFNVLDTTFYVTHSPHISRYKFVHVISQFVYDFQLQPPCLNMYVPRLFGETLFSPRSHFTQKVDFEMSTATRY